MHSLISNSETDRLAQFADTLANATDAMAMTDFRKPLAIEARADDLPVTQADRVIEAAMRQRITDVILTLGILGEEHEDARLDVVRIWVIDPVDGTKSFLSGMPRFGMLIACLADGVPDIGVISTPPTGECRTGQRGAPSRLNGVPCCTSGQQSLSKAILYTTSPDSFEPAGLAQFETLSEKVAMRRFGGDCYTYGLVASGYVGLAGRDEPAPL